MKSDHLKRHINSTHRKIKTIKCGFCDMMFSDKYKAKVCKNDNYIGGELSKRKTRQINTYISFEFWRIRLSGCSFHSTNQISPLSSHQKT